MKSDNNIVKFWIAIFYFVLSVVQLHMVMKREEDIFSFRGTKKCFCIGQKTKYKCFIKEKVKKLLGQESLYFYMVDANYK